MEARTADDRSSMKGKTCLVTGATSGMGQVTARALAQRGATVVIVGRDPARSADAADRIKQQTGNPAVELLLADLSSQAQIRKLAEQFMSRHQRLDVLVNNAGSLFMSRRESVDGIEMTFALNHLTYFLLTNILLPILKASAPSRIVNVSSYGHRRGVVNFDELQGNQRYNGMVAYRQSKLANLLFTFELARRLSGTGLTVNAVNPGLVASNFGLNNFGSWARTLWPAVQPIYQLFASSPEQGAQTAIYAATSPELEGVSGKYLERMQLATPSAAAQDGVAAARLWQLSEELTGLAPLLNRR